MKYKLLKSHKETIQSQFQMSVWEERDRRKREFFTAFMREEMEAAFTKRELEMFNVIPLTLCAALADEGNRGYVRLGCKNAKGDWDGCVHAYVNVDPKFRVPQNYELGAKAGARAKAEDFKLEKEANELIQACSLMLAGCRTTDDLRKTWPKGERFWSAIVTRIELEGGTGASTSLIPVSQVRKLDDFCQRFVTAAEAGATEG